MSAGERRLLVLPARRLRLGAWQIVLVALRAGDTGPVSMLFPTDSAVPPQRRYLWRLIRGFGWSLHLGVLSVPVQAVRAEIEGCLPRPANVAGAVWRVAVGKPVAAALLCLTDPAGALAALRGGAGRLRWYLAMRAVCAAMPRDYRLWRHLFDRWCVRPAEAEGLPLVLICHRPEAGDAALRATLASLPEAARHCVVVAGQADAVLPVIAGASERFVAVLQSGEVLRDGALLVLQRLALQGGHRAICADEDRLDAQARRHDPRFKPQPSRSLLQSGVLTTGVHLFDRALMDGLPPFVWEWAETLRLAIWLGTSALPGASAPFLLTHRSQATLPAPAAALGDVVRRHLPQGWIGRVDDSARPLMVRPDVGEDAPLVTLLVPSTGRLPHVVPCLGAVLRETDYPRLEMIIVLSQQGEITEEQRRVLAPLLEDARVRVVIAPMARFNYALANNLGAAESEASLLCLLNDDVSPADPAWLRVMAGHLQDARVAAVGAKLLYPDQTVQHGGVLLGAGGVADHAFRGLGRDEPGPLHRAVLDQELSCVTGACLLLRRAAFDALGGFDEQFATGYNDVDLCLRLIGAGHAIIWSAQALLFHHETISLGSHFSPEQAALAQAQEDLVWRRHQRVCAADPFFNPNLSRQRGQESALGFPPLVDELADRLELCRTIGVM